VIFGIFTEFYLGKNTQISGVMAHKYDVSIEFVWVKVRLFPYAKYTFFRIME